MKVVITVEHRFDRTPDGAVWTQTMFAHSFWRRYLAVFDEARVVARVRDVAVVPPDWKRADGEGVVFAPLPHYLGVIQYLSQVRRVGRAASQAIGPRDAVILRVGSPIADTLVSLLLKSGRPFAVEVVGDPYDVFAPGAVRHPLRPYLRRHFTRQLRRQCRNACGAAYVTQEALQRRYPCPRYRVGISSVELPDRAFALTPRETSLAREDPSFRLVTVGSVAQPYKGWDVLIDAAALCVRQGTRLHLTLIGDGRYRVELENQARARGLEACTRFLGQLPAGDAVRAELDEADLFVLPSRTEGLPRAMIEAMARALPCIGTDVGGIPELLPADELVPAGDAQALARRIRELLTDPQRLSAISARNLARARDYDEERLEARRTAFYRHVQACTERWLSTMAPLDGARGYDASLAGEIATR